MDESKLRTSLCRSVEVAEPKDYVDGTDELPLKAYLRVETIMRAEVEGSK